MIKVITKLFGKTHFLFIILSAIVIVLLSAEVFVYRGVVKKYFFIDTKPIISLLIVASLIFIFDKDRFDKLINILLKLFISILVVITTFFLLFGYLEEANYPNYVFTKYHINLQNLPILITVIFFTVLVLLIKQEVGLKKLGLASVHKLIIFSLIYYFMNMYIINNLSGLYGVIGKKTAFPIANPRASYDEKMFERWGFFYKYMQFVKDKTPEDSIIHIPPQMDPWILTGNAAMDRYFLYPRALVNTDNPVSNSEKVCDYLLISKGFSRNAGDWGHGWPKVPIEAERIWYIDSNTGVVEEYLDDYNPEESKEWGLIKIRVKEL